MICYDNTQELYNAHLNKSYIYSEGKSCDEIEKACRDILSDANESILLRRAKALSYILENSRLMICENELFVYGIEYSDVIAKVRFEQLCECARKNSPDVFPDFSTGYECGSFVGDADFGHNCPSYEILLSRGFSGIIKHAQSKFETEKGEKADFYKSIVIAYKAMIRLAERFAEMCKPYKENSDNARLRYEGLVNISEKAPSSLYEALEIQMLVVSVSYFVLRNNPRTLGRLDKLMYGFYKADLEAGFSQEQLRVILANAFIKYRALHFGSNTPFYLCGLNEELKDDSNELTRIILDEYIKLDVNDPKIQIRYHEDLPEDILEMVVKSISLGRNSFVFVNDKVIISALEKVGADRRDAINYALVGCYEPLCAGREIAATCSGMVVLPKAIEYALTGGVDYFTGKCEGAGTKNAEEIQSFDEFYDIVKQQIRHLFGRSVAVIDCLESQYKQVQSTPLLGACMEDCLQNGVDPYWGGAKYNNSSINAYGIATVADSLAAVKRIVFEEKKLTLAQLVDILKNNWDGAQKLRLEIMTKCEKYGNANASVDCYAREIYGFCAEVINNRPNTRGGVYRLGAFSIDWAFSFGAKVMATPDGRLSKAPISKNMCATTAMDKKGITSLINSVTSVDYTQIPNGTVLDAMLHKTVMSGDDGIKSVIGLIKTYMRLGGQALQINVFDPETLRKAQKMPEKYSNLQVRRCGWNVYFNELSKQEQDEFIKQAENA